jgi:hypothetical protein
MNKKNSYADNISVFAYLEVPWKEKSEAKRLGARWDADKKLWYVPHGTAVERFEKWLTGAARDYFANEKARIPATLNPRATYESRVKKLETGYSPPW